MELKIDTSKTYAIALDGGGARGAYQVGAWKALSEVGIKYNAVSGTSVGALNGAMMAMQNISIAEHLWLDMRFSRVMDVDDKTMSDLFRGRLLNLDYKNLTQGLKRAFSEGGFDVTPLKSLIAESVDCEAIRSGGVDFYISTYSVTDKAGLDLSARELSDSELLDMLLASAYFPAFKHEPLGGKRYTDGGAFNVFPISPLLDNGYRDIIAIRVYGMGVEKRVKIPKDAEIFTVSPTKGLGSMMNFDADSCRDNFNLGYFDAKRTLYGLYGERFYIDRTMSEMDAYNVLDGIATDYFSKKEEDISLRRLNEKLIPKITREFSSKGDYYDLLIELMEAAAAKYEIGEFEILTDRELLSKICDISKKRRSIFGVTKFLSGGRWYE